MIARYSYNHLHSVFLLLSFSNFHTCNRFTTHTAVSGQNVSCCRLWYRVGNRFGSRLRSSASVCYVSEWFDMSNVQEKYQIRVCHNTQCVHILRGCSSSVHRDLTGGSSSAWTKNMDGGEILPVHLLGSAEEQGTEPPQVLAGRSSGGLPISPHSMSMSPCTA